MAESGRGTSSAADSKEKKSSLDVDIGKDFLGSWKSLSVAGDDTMDFNFDTVSSVPKKTFNFDKLDMDFNLDGDFDKLTSFKVDMPDLDFLSPSKKTKEPKGSSKGESSGTSHQRKSDCFSFSFDFNELDSFNFHTTLTEGEKISMKNLDSKDAGANRSKLQGSKVNMAGDNEAFDDCQTDKLPASDNAYISIVETSVYGSGTGDSSNDKSPSRSENIRDLVTTHTAQTPAQKTLSVSREEADQQIHFLEKAKSAEPCAQETTHLLSVQSVDRKDFQACESDIQASSPASKVNTESGGEQNVTERQIAVVGSNHDDSQLKISDPPHANGSASSRVEGEKADSETPTGDMIGTGSLPNDLEVEATSTKNLLQKRAHDFKVNRDIQKSTSKLLVPLRSEPVLDNVIPIKEKGPEVVSSKFLLRSKETESQLTQTSTAGAQVSSSVNRGIATLCPVDGKRAGISVNDAETQRKSIGNLKSLSLELTKGEPDFQESQNNAKNPSNIREGFNGDGPDGIQNNCNLITISKHPDKEVTKGDSIVLGSGMNIKDITNFGGSSSVNPASSTDKATKSNTQTSLNSTAVVSSMGSTWNLKMASIQGLKTGKRTHDLSSLKISRTTEISKDQSNAALKREISSLRDLKKDAEVQRSTESKIVHSIFNVERKTLLTSSLKRKISEASNSNQVHLHPQKRLSQSPTESRNLKEPLKSTVKVQCCNLDNQPESDTKTILYNHSTSGLEIPNTKEDSISLTMENDGNVEKAEVYAKELGDICNMLRKKHEEAKEILVRAIVNNNSLLMLNHPMFDAKIRKVQKFAAQLISN